MCPFWRISVSFQGVMLCKNDQKLLKINISWMFWSNNVWIFLYYIILWNLFNKAHFQHFYCQSSLFYQVLAPFRGSICVKMAQNYSKLLKINISCMFWSNNVWNFCVTLFYEICLIEHIVNIFIVIVPYASNFCFLSGGNVL